MGVVLDNRNVVIVVRHILTVLTVVARVGSVCHPRKLCGGSREHASLCAAGGVGSSVLLSLALENLFPVCQSLLVGVLNLKVLDAWIALPEDLQSIRAYHRQYRLILMHAKTYRFSPKK